MSTAIDRRDTVDSGTTGESLRRFVRREIREALLEAHVAKPATVTAYDPVTQIATCSIGFLRVRTNETPAGEIETPQPPDVVFARVALLQGSTHSDHPPILPNDTGLLIFADRALDLWYRGAGLPVDPVNGRTHDQADAVFLPGLAPDTGRSAPPLNPAARTIEAPLINLGALAVSGVDNVAIASLLHAYMVAMWTAIVPVALDGGASIKATGLAYLAANPFTGFASTKVSAE